MDLSLLRRVGVGFAVARLMYNSMVPESGSHGPISHHWKLQLKLLVRGWDRMVLESRWAIRIQKSTIQNCGVDPGEFPRYPDAGRHVACLPKLLREVPYWRCTTGGAGSASRVLASASADSASARDC